MPDYWILVRPLFAQFVWTCVLVHVHSEFCFCNHKQLTLSFCGTVLTNRSILCLVILVTVMCLKIWFFPTPQLLKFHIIFLASVCQKKNKHCVGMILLIFGTCGFFFFFVFLLYCLMVTELNASFATHFFTFFFFAEFCRSLQILAYETYYRQKNDL